MTRAELDRLLNPKSMTAPRSADRREWWPEKRTTGLPELPC